MADSTGEITHSNGKTISAGGNPVDRIKITVDSGFFSGQISAQWST